jgi:hypothetical protein
MILKKMGHNQISKENLKLVLQIVAVVLSIIIVRINIFNLISKINTEGRIKENLKEELTFNIESIKEFISLKESYSNTNQFMSARLEYTYLEKFNDLSQSSKEKEGINIIIRDIKSFNRLMDIVAETPLSNIRTNNINQLCNNGEVIKQNIDILKEKFDLED